MAKKCFYVEYTNCSNVSGTAYLCAEDLEYRSGGSCGGGYFYSVSNGYDASNASEKSGSVTIVACSNCAGCCTDPPPTGKCDCVNGGCVPQATYNTPGKYANLAACESGCSKDSPCDGECVSAAEIAALQQAANALQARLCR
jgi:hypothetical protein